MVSTKIDLDQATITELGPLIRGKKLSPVELIQATLDRVEQLQPKLQSFITITAELAMRRAKEMEREIMQGHYRGPFHGIPYTLKDVIATKGVKTTWGDPREGDYKPQENATLYTQLDEAGGILLGKVVSEIGRVGGGTVGCRNAWDPTRSPGTSSSGGGSATAASMGLGSIGTDTGGSVRHPGSNSGLVAFKPTYGRISIHGVHGSVLTTDQAGPITKTVEDNAIMMDILGVYDPKATNSILAPRYDHRAYLKDGIKGLRIGVPVDDWVWKHTLHEEEEVVCRKAIQQLEELGASITEVKLSRAGDARTNGLASSRGPSALYYLDHFTKEQLAGWPGLANPEEGVKEPVERFLRLLEQRAWIKQEVNEVLATVDIIAMPTGSTWGDTWDDKEVTIRGKKWAARSRASYRNNLASLCGHPAVSVPCGFGDIHTNWPIGIMFHGRDLSEPLLLQVGYAYEQATPWHKRHPDIQALLKGPDVKRLPN